MKQTLQRFWARQPALFIGIHLVLGAAWAVRWDPLWLLPLPFLFLLAPSPKEFVKGQLYAIGMTLYALWASPFSPLPPQIMGTAHIHFTSLKVQASPFQRSHLYQGTIESFTSEGTKLPIRHLPCKLFLPLYGKRPPADKDYLIPGTLQQKGKEHYVFKPLKKSPWEPIERTFSFAELRFRAKKTLATFLHQQLPRSASLLSALITGDLEDRLISLEFGKLGLQHILAISGFHFALVAAFFGGLFRLILSPKAAALALIGFLTLYFFFIGPSPSVQRAFVAILFSLIGYLIRRRCFALNAVGLGLIFELILQPRSVLHVGFQLSFLATVAILTLYGPCLVFCERLFPKRSPQESAKMPLFDLHGYLLTIYLRKACALSLAIFLFTLPTLLFLFHRFPLLSLLYNLFIPFGIAIALYLLFFAGLVYAVIPPLGTLFFRLTDGYTAGILALTAHPPTLLDFHLRAKILPLPVVVVGTLSLFVLGIFVSEWVEKEKFLIA